MRLVALAALAVLAAACERAGEAPAPQPAPRFEIPVSDELPGLAAPATGVAFWDHPALPFNSMMIVAGAQGVIAFNIEDGVEAARIDGVPAEGAAVSYLGRGPQATGVMALFDSAQKTFSFYGVDNVSRRFRPLDGGPAVEGDVHGFCFGRAQEMSAPSLFVLQNAQILIFNFDAAGDGLALAGESAVEAPAGLASCAVDIDGVLIVAADDGTIYRIDGPESFARPFASADVAEAGDLSLTASAVDDEASGETIISGQIILLDKADGAAHVFDRANGEALGVITVSGTEQMAGVAAANAMGLSGANLGALYRNGVVAYAVMAQDGPAIRLIPYNAVLNALALPEGTAPPPRGAAPAAERDSLLIDAPFPPGQ